MSIIQKIGFALIGATTLAEIKKEVVELTTRTVLATEGLKSFFERTTSSQREDFIANELFNAGRIRQVQAALLVQLVGGEGPAFTITEAARKAEETGEGFMKKKAAVLKVVKELGLSKSASQLAIELAVQLSKD